MTESKAPQRSRHMRTVVPLLGVLAMMGTLMYYAVPLYNMFCQVTGIGGTTQRAEASAMPEAIDREITVRFDTQVQPGLPWDFAPEQRQVTMKLGEPRTVFFRAESHADREIVGHASFNVTPLKVGQYVTKVECFCFTEERLGPGESVRMPVQLFVDPKLAADSSTDEVKTVTMSYHFFESTKPEGAKDLKRLDTPDTAPDTARDTAGDTAGTAQNAETDAAPAATQQAQGQ